MYTCWSCKAHCVHTCQIHRYRIRNDCCYYCYYNDKGCVYSAAVIIVIIMIKGMCTVLSFTQGGSPHLFTISDNNTNNTHKLWNTCRHGHARKHTRRQNQFYEPTRKLRSGDIFVYFIFHKKIIIKFLFKTKRDSKSEYLCKLYETIKVRFWAYLSICHCTLSHMFLLVLWEWHNWLWFFKLTRCVMFWAVQPCESSLP